MRYPGNLPYLLNDMSVNVNTDYYVSLGRAVGPRPDHECRSGTTRQLVFKSVL